MTSVEQTALDHLASENVDLQDRNASLEADNYILQTLVSEALTALHDVTAERNRLRDQLRLERAETRRLREFYLREAA